VGTVTGTFDGPPPPPTTFTDTPHQNVGAGTSPISISEVLTVQPFVTYFVRAVGSNAAGTTLGSLVSFTAGSRPVLGQTSGFLGGTCSGGSTCVQMSSSVNPEFAPTEAWFEVGRDTLLSTFTSTAHQAIAPSFNNTPFSASLAVAAGTPVFFRAAASNALGTVRGVVIHAFPQVIILGKP
ncbi:MAG TPA: hypothetical protein VKP00_05825, partial [Gemmatimonadaceae bacterium]|nr:hypothetical protein [Gemmatimonadaceae bacterium]